MMNAFVRFHLALSWSTKPLSLPQASLLSLSLSSEASPLYKLRIGFHWVDWRRVVNGLDAVSFARIVRD